MGVSSVSVSSMEFFVGDGVIQPVFCGEENKHLYKFNRHQERIRERKILFNYCFVYTQKKKMGQQQININCGR
jgi:hypothetical protein